MDFKIDHIFSEKDRLSIRFAPRWTYRNKVNSFDSPMDPYSQGHQKYDAYSFALNHTHSFSTKTLLNISLGYIIQLRFRRQRGPSLNFILITTSPKELGVPEYLKISGALRHTGHCSCQLPTEPQEVERTSVMTLGGSTNRHRKPISHVLVGQSQPRRRASMNAK